MSIFHAKCKYKEHEYKHICSSIRMVEGILSQFQINAPTYKYIHLTSTCVHMLATSDIIQQLFPYSDIAITSTISLKFQQPRLYLDYSNMYKQSMFKQNRLLQKNCLVFVL